MLKRERSASRVARWKINIRNPDNYSIAVIADRNRRSVEARLQENITFFATIVTIMYHEIAQSDASRDLCMTKFPIFTNYDYTLHLILFWLLRATKFRHKY